MQKASLKFISKTLGISVATVSKALNDYPDVSKKTRDLVCNLAKELNYKPNSFAVNLRTKESKTIGLIIPVIVHYFFSNVIEGILKEAENEGYLVIILQSNDSYELEKKQINNITFGKIPIIVNSRYCVLNLKGLEEECKYDPGGYVIINGNEKRIILIILFSLV